MHRLAQGENLHDLIVAAIERARRSARLDEPDAAALTLVAAGTPFKAGDLTEVYGANASARSRRIGSLLERRLISRVEEGGRIYRIRLSPNALTPFVFAEFDSMGLLPQIIRDDLV